MNNRRAASSSLLAFIARLSSFIVAALLEGCTASRAPSSQVNAASPPQRYAVVFFVDGLACRPFEALLAAGKLPNIQRVFVDGGVRVEHAVVSMPSITYANSVSLLTGVFPGHHGVVGNRWFDRQSALLRDYGYLATYEYVNTDFTCPTIFELLKDRYTVCIRAHTDRGATQRIEDPILTGLDWITDNHRNVDTRVGNTVDEVIRNARSRGEWPAVYWNYLPAVDEIGHRHGADSAEYAAAIVNADAAIGRVVAGVERDWPAGAVYYALVSDHGHMASPPDHAFDIPAWLRETWGRRVLEGDLQWGSAASRERKLATADTVVTSEAFRRGAISLLGRDGWTTPADPPLVRQIVEGDAEHAGLAAQPAIVLACYREGESAIRVVARHGQGLSHGRIEFRGERSQREYRYMPDAGGNPLGYSQPAERAAFVAAGWHDSRAWLAATADAEIPDFVPQIVALFDSPHAGDIVAFADSDWTFDKEWKGGHGSCLASDMCVPYFFAGPGLPKHATIPCGRTVDLVPTLLDLIGESVRMNAKAFDGSSLAGDLQACKIEQ